MKVFFSSFAKVQKYEKKEKNGVERTIPQARSFQWIYNSDGLPLSPALTVQLPAWRPEPRLASPSPADCWSSAASAGYEQLSETPAPAPTTQANIRPEEQRDIVTVAVAQNRQIWSFKSSFCHFESIEIIFFFLSGILRSDRKLEMPTTVGVFIIL